MRNLQELKDIVSKLDTIEELKESLQCILGDINTLSQKGHLWIDKSESKSYQEIKKLLESETADLLRRCYFIASNGHQKVSEQVLTEDQLNEASSFASLEMTSSSCKDEKDNEDVFRQNEEVTSKTSDSEQLKALEKKMKQQSKKYNAKFEEIMKELQAASNFMTNMSEELNEIHEKEKIQDNKIQETSQKVENYLEQKDSMAKEQEEDLKKEIKRLTKELDSTQELLATRESEITQLKTDAVIANEALKMKDKEIVRLILPEDLNSCIETVIKNKRGISNQVVHAFWSSGYIGKKKTTRQEYVSDYWCLTDKHKLAASSGPEIVSSVTALLYELGLGKSECKAFWDEYIKYQNKLIGRIAY